MATRCAKCGKGILRGRRVTFSGKRNKRIFKPNLHTLWVVERGKRVRKKFCTKCLRRVKKEKKGAETVVAQSI